METYLNVVLPINTCILYAENKFQQKYHTK